MSHLHAFHIFKPKSEVNYTEDSWDYLLGTSYKLLTTYHIIFKYNSIHSSAAWKVSTCQGQVLIGHLCFTRPWVKMLHGLFVMEVVSVHIDLRQIRIHCNILRALLLWFILFWSFVCMLVVAKHLVMYLTDFNCIQLEGETI